LIRSITIEDISGKERKYTQYYRQTRKEAVRTKSYIKLKESSALFVKGLKDTLPEDREKVIRDT